MKEVLRKPGFWLILALLVLITLPHYGEALRLPAFFAQMTSNLGLDRHAFERILYLAPIVWAGFMFGWRGALITSLAAIACMLPRALFISLSPKMPFLKPVPSSLLVMYWLLASTLSVRSGDIAPS